MTPQRTTPQPSGAKGHEPAQGGYTLVEVLVATVILGMVATALTQTLLTGLRARHTSARWMRATQLAGEAVERIRAGNAPGEPTPAGLFERTAVLHPVPGYPNLERVEVVVTWHDRGPQSFTLIALVTAAR